MKTFQCTKCGCSLMQPTEPFRCPQCGSQGIGLFRAIGEAGNTGYGMNQGFRPQQPGTFQPQNSGFGASQGAFQPNVYGQSGVFQQQGMNSGMGAQQGMGGAFQRPAQPFAGGMSASPMPGGAMPGNMNRMGGIPGGAIPGGAISGGFRTQGGAFPQQGMGGGFQQPAQAFGGGTQNQPFTRQGMNQPGSGFSSGTGYGQQNGANPMSPFGSNQQPAFNQAQGVPQPQPAFNQAQGVPQPQSAFNQAQGVPQPQPAFNQAQGVPQPQPAFNQAQGVPQPQPAFNQAQGVPQPQPAFNQAQGVPQPQPAFNQAQGGGQPSETSIPEALPVQQQGTPETAAQVPSGQVPSDQAQPMPAASATASQTVSKPTPSGLTQKPGLKPILKSGQKPAVPQGNRPAAAPSGTPGAVPQPKAPASPVPRPVASPQKRPTAQVAPRPVRRPEEPEKKPAPPAEQKGIRVRQVVQRPVAAVQERPRYRAPEPRPQIRPEMDRPERCFWGFPEEPPFTCDARPMRNAPVIDEKGRMVMVSQGKLFCLDISRPEPEVVWEYLIKAHVPGPIVVDPHGDYHLHAMDGYLHMVTKDGRQSYRPVLVGEPLGYAAPIVDGWGNTLISSYGGGLIRVNSQGQKDSRPYFRSRAKLDSSGVIAGGILYIGSEDGYLFAIDLDDAGGKLIWDQAREVGYAGGFLNSSPAIAPDGTIVVATRAEKLIGFNSVGDILWTAYMPGQLLASPVIDANGNIYVGASISTRQGNKGYLVCVDGVSHKIRWQYETDDMIESTPCIGDDGTIYFGNNSGWIFALNSMGDKKWSAKFEAGIRSAGTIIAPNLLAFALDDDVLVGVRCESKELCDSGWPKLGHDNFHSFLGPVAPPKPVSEEAPE